MSDMILYKYPFPSRAERVMWMLDELGFAYQTQEINPMRGEHLSADFLAVNPYGKVPALVHQGKSYTESLAIMMYLNELHPEQPLTPKDVETRFLMHQALSFGMTEIEAYAWIYMQATKFNMVYGWQEGTSTTAIKRLEQAMPMVWQWLSERSYIAGNEFSLADIYYYTLLRWVERLGIPIPVEVEQNYLSQLEKRPHFLQTLRSH